jgi:hypothetical protein
MIPAWLFVSLHTKLLNLKAMSLCKVCEFLASGRNLRRVCRKSGSIEPSQKPAAIDNRGVHFSEPAMINLRVLTEAFICQGRFEFGKTINNQLAIPNGANAFGFEAIQFRF